MGSINYFCVRVLGNLLLLFVLLFCTDISGWAQTQELRGVQQEVVRLFKARRYEDALPYALQAVHMSEEEYGKEHPTTATFIFNLGKLYQLGGWFDQSALYYQQALGIRSRVFDQNHPDLAASYFSLGRVFSDQCKYEIAEGSFNDALEVMERALGDNPHVVNSLSRTAHIYRAHAFQNRAKLRHFQGKYSEADNLYGAAVRMLQGLLGESHLDLGLALTSYAQLLREMDRLEEAQQKEALAERIFASNHSHRDVQHCQF